MDVPVPATLTELSGLAELQYLFGFVSSNTGMPGEDGTVRATPLRWKVTASVASWPNVASNGCRRLPSLTPSANVIGAGRASTGSTRPAPGCEIVLLSLYA